MRVRRACHAVSWGAKTYLHGDQIAEPLVGQLVGDDHGDALLVGGRRLLRVVEERRLAEGYQAPVLCARAVRSAHNRTRQHTHTRHTQTHTPCAKRQACGYLHGASRVVGDGDEVELAEREGNAVVVGVVPQHVLAHLRPPQTKIRQPTNQEQLDSGIDRDGRGQR